MCGYPNQPRGLRFVGLQRCFASRYSGRPADPSSRAHPGLLEAAPFRLRDVRTVVVDPLRAQVQRDLWPNQWGARIQFAERRLATYAVRIADASIT